jgi:methionyl-tRNA formyltransferase
MRVLFAGTPEAAVPSLRAILASSHEVVAVLTRPDAPAGRGRRLMPSPVAAIALAEGIELLRPARAGDPEFLERLAQIAPDAAPIVAYGGLIPPAALVIPTHGWVNLHFSLLPAWRGAAPVQHAVMAGDQITGASTFRLEEGLDTGPVFGVVTDEIRPTDTAGDLLDRLAVSGAGLLVATLDGLESGALVAVAQSGEDVSLAPKIRVEDARVAWTDPAMRVDRLIRGCTPAPGAWSEFRGERIKLGPVRPAQDVVDLSAGEVRVVKNHVWVGTATHAVLLGEVKAEGKRQMAAGDWARGVRVEPGEHLG